MNKIKKNWAIIVLLISSTAILSALIAEYLFDILPCQMCLYQRYPYYFIILFSIIYIFTNKTDTKNMIKSGKPILKFNVELFMSQSI